MNDKCRNKTRPLQAAPLGTGEGDPEQVSSTTSPKHNAEGRTPPWRMPQGTPPRQPLWQGRTPLWRTLPGTPLKLPSWQDLLLISRFIAFFTTIVIIMIVVSSPGSTSFSKQFTALLSSCTARLFALTAALTVIYVVGSSTSPTSSCLKKMGKKRGETPRPKSLRAPSVRAHPPTFPTPPASLKKGGIPWDAKGKGWGKGRKKQSVC